VLAASIVLLVGLSWAFLFKNSGMEAMQPPLSALVAMWWIMMVAMMLPSATPAILLYARVRQSRDDAAIARSWVFLLGYLSIWFAFSTALALAQWSVVGARIAHSHLAEGALLVAAGAYQLSPFKFACMTQCRSPAAFISRHWRPGWDGALRLGVIHGTFCVGCCWLLMALLFVGGVMNLLWVVGLTILVAGEKLLPGEDMIRKGSALVLICWGAFRAFS